MKLYQLPQSNHRLNVRLVAHEVGEKLELIDVDVFGGETQSPEHLRKNPNGTFVPLDQARNSPRRG